MKTGKACQAAVIRDVKEELGPVLPSGHQVHQQQLWLCNMPITHGAYWQHAVVAEPAPPLQHI